MVNSKRISILKKKIAEKFYPIDLALSLLKETATAKFIESAEAHICLNMNSRQVEQQLKSTLVLPYGTGKKLKIAVLTEPESYHKISASGADIIGCDDLIENIKNNLLDFDVLITMPKLVTKLANKKIGKILASKGLMPSAKMGTVVENVESAIRDFRNGKIIYRVDKAGIIHLNFGKVNFSLLELKENLMKVYESINKDKPNMIERKYIKSLTICASMGPAISINLNSFKK